MTILASPSDLRAGQQFAAGPGLATVLPDFDFETVSFAGFLWNVSEGKWASLPGFGPQKRGLPAVGVRVYVEHPSFSPQLLAYDLKDGRGARQWEMGDDPAILQPLFNYILAGGIIEAHNAGFEFQVWNYWCVPVLGWPALRIEQLRCSAAKSRANGLPGSLEPLGEVLQIEHQKDKEGKRLMKLFSIPRNPSKKDPRLITFPHEAPEEWAGYKRYNLTDIVAEAEVSIRSPDLSPFEQDAWFADQHINDRGMQVDTAGVDNCIAVLEQAYAKYGAEIRGITGGIEASELKQLQGWLASQGVSMMGMTDKDVTEMLERLNAQFQANDGDMWGPYTAPYRVLELRQMLGSASVKKLYALNACATVAGRLHDLYMFMATHHGRWTGNGPQPQNLYKGEWHTPEEVDAALAVLATRSLDAVEAAYPGMSPLDVINNVLRSLFIAAPGHTLISSDYSAIEAVVLAVLAGEEWRLEVFRRRGDIYEASISKMTGTPLAEFAEYKARGKKHPLRQQGKLAELSGGYASWIGGWKKFGADKYYRDDYELKEAILAFRNASPAIVEFWGGQTRNKFNRDAAGNWAPARPELFGLEGAAIAAVQNPGAAYHVGLIGLQMLGDALYMRLPSGRLITYHTPRLRPSSRPYSDAWELELSYWGWNSNPEKGPPAWIQMDLYGGVLTQNACGGTARDIMAHGILNLERAGYPVVMHTHDEPVAEVSGFAVATQGLSVAGLEVCLNDLPTWAKGWPVAAAGGWMGPRYGKWE